MCNPAKYATGLGFFLRKKGGPNCFVLNNKGGFGFDPVGDVSYFFCHKNRRFPLGVGGSLSGPRLLWLAWLAKALLAAKKKVTSDLRGILKYGR